MGGNNRCGQMKNNTEVIIIMRNTAYAAVHFLLHHIFEMNTATNDDSSVSSS